MIKVLLQENLKVEIDIKGSYFLGLQYFTKGFLNA